jgi:hypothetical protein
MAQMTEALCAEAMAHCERGVFPPLTVNEMQQLLYAWKDAQRYRWLRSRFDACAASCTFAQDDDGKVWRDVEQNIDAGMILDAQIDAARAAVGAA